MTDPAPRRPLRGLFATVLLAGSAFGMTACNEAAIMTFTERDTRIVVDVDSEFQVRLESNVTTGYTWRVSELPSRLRLVGERYVEPTDGRIGQGGHQVFTFRAIRAGTTRLELEYVRPSEEGEPPARSETFEVDIR